MKPYLLLFACYLIMTGCTPKPEEKISQENPAAAANDPETEIRNVMSAQMAYWNEGNIEAFMEGYWKSDSMQFIGRSIQQGWNATLERYKKSYPDLDAMGKLQFDLWQVVRISDDAYLVTGQYTLTRIHDNPSGPFTLIFRLKNGKWVITYDHTS